MRISLIKMCEVAQIDIHSRQVIGASAAQDVK